MNLAHSPKVKLVNNTSNKLNKKTVPVITYANKDDLTKFTNNASLKALCFATFAKVCLFLIKVNFFLLSMANYFFFGKFCKNVFSATVSVKSRFDLFTSQRSPSRVLTYSK